MELQALAAIFVLAVLVEALIEYLGQPIPSAYKPYAAALVGIGLCLAYNADMLALLGLQAGIPYVGQLLTGAIISRGANYLNDLIARLRGERPPAPPANIIAVPSGTVVHSTSPVPTPDVAQSFAASLRTGRP